MTSWVRPRVAAVVVGTNEQEWLGEALRSLRRSAGQGTQFDLDVYYVDNDSNDGSVEYVAKAFPGVTIIANPSNLGFAAANNRAIRRALAEGSHYVFLVNPDTFTPPDLVAELTEFMEEWPGYGVVGPRQWRYERGATHERLDNDWTLGALAAGEAHILHPDRPSLAPPADPGTPRAPGTVEHSYVQGAAFFARADLLWRIGLFDEVFHTFYEESDLCRRARLAGWRVAVLTGVGIHHRGGAADGGPYRRLQMMRNKYYFLFTDPDLPRADVWAIAGGWVRNDVTGHGVGGRSSIARALTEFARSAWWLGARLHTVLRRRRHYGALRGESSVRPLSRPADRVDGTPSRPEAG